jgi:CO/xanthine dehydrogenase Mo-binding subunit
MLKLEIQCRQQGVQDNPYIKEAWGVAFCCHTSGPAKKAISSSVILVNDDGTANLLTGSADIGQGSETILSQIAAEGLGIDLKDVTITAADTKVTPYDTGTYASSQAYVAGNAVSLAAEDAKEKIRKELAKVYEVAEEDVTYKDRCFVINSPNDTEMLTLRGAMAKIAFGQRGIVITGSSSYKAAQEPSPFAVCWAKVAVDTSED